MPSPFDHPSNSWRGVQIAEAPLYVSLPHSPVTSPISNPNAFRYTIHRILKLKFMTFCLWWRAPQPWGLLCNPVMKMKAKMIRFFIFPSNGAPVEWNWQGKTVVLG
jgi:hypothetical protein